MIILITGFMCCGKTTVGKYVSKSVGMKFYDLDEEIERLESKKVSQIFSDFGEKQFRLIEHIAFKDLLEKNKDENIILSAGGGLLTFNKNINLLSKCLTIFLDIPWRIIKIRLSDKNEKSIRPIAYNKTPLELFRLWQKRRKTYLNNADIIIRVIK